MTSSAVTFRHLQQVGAQSVRRPDVRNVAARDVRGFQTPEWPYGRFSTFPGISKFHFEVKGDDMNIDEVRVSLGLKSAGVKFTDRNADDPYIYSITGVELPVGSVKGSFYSSGSKGCVSSTEENPAPPGTVPVLTDFRFFWTRHNFDRNLGHIRVQVESSPTNHAIARVCYADYNYDDEYIARVDYAYVDENYVYGFEELSNTQVGGGVDLSRTFEAPPNTVPVLTGFDLDYLSGDRDIKEMLVELSQDGRAYINFRDDTNNDSYAWRVNMAYIGGSSKALNV